MAQKLSSVWLKLNLGDSVCLNGREYSIVHKESWDEYKPNEYETFWAGVKYDLGAGLSLSILKEPWGLRAIASQCGEHTFLKFFSWSGCSPIKIVSLTRVR